MEKDKKYLILETVVIFLIAFFLGSSLFVTPFFGEINFIDEGQFGAWSYQMLNGKLMYKDIYITYGPLYVYPLFVLFKIFGPSAFLVRLLYVTLNSALGIALVNLLLHQMEFKKVSRWLVIFLLFALPGISLRMSLGFLIIPCLLKAISEKKHLLSFIVGALLSIAFLISPEIGLFSALLVFVFYLYFLIAQADLKFILGKILWTALGSVLVLALFFFWSKGEGWFSSYMEVTKDVLISFSGINSPNGTAFPNPLKLGYSIFSKEMLLYWELFFYLITSLYLFVKTAMKTISKHDRFLIFLSLYGLLLYVILIGRSGHFFFTLPILIIIAVYFAQELFLILVNIHKKYLERILALTLLIIILAFSIRLFLIFRPHFSKIASLLISTTKPRDNPKGVGPILISNTQKEKIKNMQNFISENTTREEKVFFVNDEPMMYLLVDRSNPTRFDLPYIANTKEKRMEILNDLIEKKPKYIFENIDAWAVDGISNIRRLPEIVEFLKKNYTKETLIGNAIVYSSKER